MIMDHPWMCGQRVASGITAWIKKMGTQVWPLAFSSARGLSREDRMNRLPVVSTGAASKSCGARKGQPSAQGFFVGHPNRYRTSCSFVFSFSLVSFLQNCHIVNMFWTQPTPKTEATLIEGHVLKKMTWFLNRYYKSRPTHTILHQPIP